MKIVLYLSPLSGAEIAGKVDGAGRWRRPPTLCPLLYVCALLLLCLAGCADTTGGQSQAVNGFGVASNHGHALLALPDNSILLATHFGLYRSADSGRIWSGPDQTIGAMMTSSLSSNALNGHRVYVLAETTTSDQKGTVGLYVSSDEGRNWELGSAAADTGKMFTVVAGNRSVNEVYAYVPQKGAQGLLQSEDGGKHFIAPGRIPFGRLNGIQPIPNAPGQLLIYSSDGAARSTDGGKHWRVIKSLTSSVYSIVTGGPRSMLYASSDQGIYASKDSGATFKQVFAQSRSALTAVPDEPLWLYGKTGRLVYKSEDGGRSWLPLPAIKGNLENLAPDPHNVANLYLSLSYPMGIYRYDEQDSSWMSLTPKVNS
jgi:BNR/Asp-box repeat.